jgi:hypothetical protein
MLMKDLPPFQRRKRDDVVAFISSILINANSAETSYLIDLLEYPDGHFRAVFDPHYFVLQNSQTEPTKSQWNGLKKKLKRHDPLVFVFKDYGYVDGKQSQVYLDFGFLAAHSAV